MFKVLLYINNNQSRLAVKYLASNKQTPPPPSIRMFIKQIFRLSLHKKIVMYTAIVSEIEFKCK